LQITPTQIISSHVLIGWQSSFEYSSTLLKLSSFLFTASPTFLTVKLVSHVLAALSAALLLSTSADAGDTTGPCSFEVDGPVTGSGCDDWAKCFDKVSLVPKTDGSTTPEVFLSAGCFQPGVSGFTTVKKGNSISVQILLKQGYRTVLTGTGGPGGLLGGILDAQANTVCEGKMKIVSGTCLYSDRPAASSASSSTSASAFAAVAAAAAGTALLLL
jgi:hypothetical protein